MKISILCNDGSPLGVVPETIYGDDRRIGVGGAELALLTLAEHWSKSHEVVLYNDPWKVPTREEIEKLALKGEKPLDQRPIKAFNPLEERDILIIFRSPNHLAHGAKGKKVWWSCDQSTVGGFADFGRTVDKIITISPYHQKYFSDNYGLQSNYIDLPVRGQDYTEEFQKVPSRMLFSSVPDRGLQVLAQCYPAIKDNVPEASLTITSDYRLWGAGPNNDQFRSMFFGMKDVVFLGAVSRNRLIEEQQLAEILTYPNIPVGGNKELFCYAVAEAQYAGILPITSNMGALESTNMGIQVVGDPNDISWRKKFVEVVCDLLTDRKLLSKWNEEIREIARKRFDIDRISSEWDQLTFE